MAEGLWGSVACHVRHASNDKGREQRCMGRMRWVDVQYLCAIETHVHARTLPAAQDTFCSCPSTLRSDSYEKLGDASQSLSECAERIVANLVDRTLSCSYSPPALRGIAV